MTASVPPVVARVAQRFHETTQGIVAFALHRTFFVHAGPMSRRDDLLLDGVYVNGTLVKVRVLHDTIGGKSAPASQVAALVHSYEHPEPGDVFEAPFDPRYLAQYGYDASAGSVAFTPVRPVYGLGAGTFSYDARDDVTGYSYAPSVLPEHTTSGRIADQRAQVLPDYWAVTLETQTYQGHYSLFSGGATVQIVYSGFRSFPSLTSASNAIAAGLV